MSSIAPVLTINPVNTFASKTVAKQMATKNVDEENISNQGETSYPSLGSTGTTGVWVDKNTSTFSFDYITRYKLTATSLSSQNFTLKIDPALQEHVVKVELKGNTSTSNKGVTLVKDKNGNYTYRLGSMYKGAFIGYNQKATISITTDTAVNSLNQDRYKVQMGMYTKDEKYISRSGQQVILTKNNTDLNIDNTNKYITAGKLGFENGIPAKTDTVIALKQELQYQVTLETFARDSYYVYQIDPALVPYLSHVKFTGVKGNVYDNVSIPEDGKIRMDAESLYDSSLGISVPYSIKIEAALKNGVTIGDLPQEYYVITAHQNYSDSSSKAGITVDHSYVSVGIKGSKEAPIPDAPSVDKIKANDTKISGKATMNNTVTVTLPNGEQYTGKADQNGNYTITVPAQKVGEQVKVTQTSAQGKESAATTATVESNEKPVINANPKTIQVGDTFDPLAGVTASDKEDGNLTSKIQVMSNNVNPAVSGVYSVSYSVTDSDGNKASKSVQITVQSLNGSIDVNTFYLGKDSWLNGKFNGDIAKVGLEVNGKKHQVVNVSGTSYQYYAKDKILNLQDDVKIVGYSKDNKVIQATKVKVVDSSILQGDIKANKYAVGTDSFVSGTYTGAIKKISMTVNGKPYSKVDVGANNKFQYYAKDKISSKKDVVEIIGYNAEGTEISRTVVDLSDASEQTGNLVPAVYAIADDSFVKGSFTGNVERVAIQVNGVTYPAVNALNSSSFQYYAKDKIRNITDDVKVLGYNSANLLVDSKPVKVVQSHEGNATLTPVKYSIADDSFVKGTYKGAVKTVALEVNGTKYAPVAVMNSSEFQYYAKDKIKKPSDNVKVYGYDSTGTVVDTKSVTVVASNSTTGQVSPMDYNIETDGFVKGTYTGDIKNVALQVNGTTYSPVNVINESSFQYYAKDKIKNTSDTVKVLAYNSQGVLMDTKSVKVTDASGTSGSINVNPYTFGTDSWVTGIYTGGVSKVALKVDGVEHMAVAVQDNGTFKYYAKDKITRATRQVEVIAYSAKNKVIDSKFITIK
ncbi:immunoglobulin-like domain-containing protein [Paenilisteria rocourtiae]|nr:immunoglobulin-like domain-containing protein [Listeria rocourtiae]